jgi:hypothetical protein
MLGLGSISGVVMPVAQRLRRARPTSLLAALLGPLMVISTVLGFAAPARASLIGELSGTVTGGGAALPNVWVTLTPVTEGGTEAGTPKLALTDESGRYEFPEVYDRNVKIHVRAPGLSPFVDTYYPDAHTFAQAEVLEISSWPITADIDLPEGGSVTGQVVDLDTGDPVEGARVIALVADAHAAGPLGAQQAVDAPGGFAITGLPPVQMKLRVRLPPGSPYLFTIHSPGATTPGVLIDGSRDTNGTVVGLHRGAEIRGTVRDRSGEPVPGATVKVIGCNLSCPLLATSDETGAYRIVAVPPGSRLGVLAWRGEELLRQWFPDRNDASEANDISLGHGDVLESVDFSLVRAGFVRVRVLAADSGEPLPGMIVMLTSEGVPSSRYVMTNQPGAAVRQRLGPIAPGRYTLRVIPGVANPQYETLDPLIDEVFAPGGVIVVDPGAEIDLVAKLAAATADTSQAGSGQPVGADAASGRAPTRECDSPEPHWPGLAAGFLERSAWPAVDGSDAGAQDPVPGRDLSSPTAAT